MRKARGERLENGGGLVRGRHGRGHWAQLRCIEANREVEGGRLLISKTGAMTYRGPASTSGCSDSCVGVPGWGQGVESKSGQGRGAPGGGGRGKGLSGGGVLGGWLPGGSR